jgi:hypothetical protein
MHLEINRVYSPTGWSRKVKMKIIETLPIGLAPLFLMSYGWYLGQLHQSGYDVAGIFLFTTGAVGLVLAIIFFLLTRKYPFF